MRINIHQELRTAQQMRLSPQVIQSIELLQLPIQDLLQEIKTELEENPALEMREEQPDEQDNLTAEQAERSRELEEKRLEYLDELSQQSDDYIRTRKTSPGVNAADKRFEALQNTPGKGVTLSEHLLQQLSELDLTEREDKISETIVHSLNSDGYLQYGADEIAASLPGLFGEMGTEDAAIEVEEVLDIVQALDPSGVGARDTKECLLLQLDPADRNYELLHRLIDSFLDDIGKNRLPHVARELGLDIEELKLLIGEMRKLNPKPGAQYDQKSLPTIIPDVKVDLIDGKYEVILEDESIPKLIISRYVRELLQKENLTDEEKEYLVQKVESGKRLISSIEHRKSTIGRISQALVEIQQEFFQKGISALRPLKMEEVADQIGVHVSTVSRAVNGKYMQTPKGIYPLKFFFTGATQSDTGADESRLSVQETIRKIVEQEDKNSPLNDEEIAEKLREQGLKIARRTVTKYRKQLNIPSARQRREY